MQILMTGGTGFIGRAVCDRLLREGHTLTVFTRTPRESSDSRTRFVVWQPGTPGAWETALAEGDGVVNLAGEPIATRWSPEQKQRILASRVGTTRALIQAMRTSSRKPSVFISASAVGYYGPRSDERLDESSPPGVDFLAQVCQQWEGAAQEASSLGVRVIPLRIGVVLERSGGALAKMLPPFLWFAGGPIGSGRQWISWIHREDVAGLIAWALQDARVRGPLNATAPNPVTMREFCRILGDVLRRPSWAPVPAAALRLMFGEMADVLLTGQRVLPDAALRLGYPFRFPTLHEALSAILARPGTRKPSVGTGAGRAKTQDTSSELSSLGV